MSREDSNGISSTGIPSPSEKKKTPPKTEIGLRTQDLVSGLVPILLMSLMGKGRDAAEYAQGYMQGKMGKLQKDTEQAKTDFAWENQEADREKTDLYRELDQLERALKYVSEDQVEHIYARINAIYAKLGFLAPSKAANPLDPLAAPETSSKPGPQSSGSSDWTLPVKMESMRGYTPLPRPGFERAQRYGKALDIYDQDELNKLGQAYETLNAIKGWEQNGMPSGDLSAQSVSMLQQLAREYREQAKKYADEAKPYVYSPEYSKALSDKATYFKNIASDMVDGYKRANNLFKSRPSPKGKASVRSTKTKRSD